MYVTTKDYPFAWGSPPADLDQGSELLREWLEAKKVPPLRDATPALRRQVRKKFELDDDVLIYFLVLGAPRSENGKVPYFYAWVEWVHESKLPFDLDHRRYVRKAGVAKVAIEGFGEKNLELRDWHWAERLEGLELHEWLPWDAAVLTRKMYDYHLARPRYPRERANGTGRNAKY